ncbi:sensor histidine kinase [Sphaerotilus uruguayifluvii]|uniref:histidine kinase n=1 Tax=Sphaerotilus uruguayifluvii TaxID=2735897 RepID=A0ABX2FZV8_9BURK|nr:ATP-binding protein [Leptothrix sp. C29]NRT55578.1 PAS domain S-box-containing protein [Leptothrix sp. C29]
MSSPGAPELPIDLVPDAAVLAGADDGRVRGANAAARRLFGPDGLGPGERLDERIAPEHRAQLDELLRRPVADVGPRIVVRLAGSGPAGAAVQAMLRVGPRVEGPRGAVRLWQFEEIGRTERHDPLHMRIFDAMPHAMLVIDEAARVLAGNAAALALFGLDPLSMRGRRIDQLGWTLLDARGRPQHGGEPLRQHLLPGERPPGPRPLAPVHLRAPDGRERWLDITTTPVALMPGLAPASHVCAIVDVTAQMQAERLRAGSDRRLERFMQLSPGAPFALQLIGDPARLRFTLLSPGLCRAFGRDEGELTDPGFRVLPHVHAEDRDRLADGMREAVRRLGDFHLEFRIVHPIRGPVWHEARAAVEIDENGRPGAYGYLLDIGARKRAEQQIEALHASLEQRVSERTAELEAKHREMERFTYSVSHDLKAPLRGLDGYSRLLLSEKAAQLDEEGRLFVDNIRRAANQMSQLIEDLLAYSRIERLRPTLVPIVLQDLVDETLAEVGGCLAHAGAEVATDLGALVILGERKGLLLTLRNLVDNAIKFRRPDRPLRLSISAISRPDAQGRAGVELSVGDNGIGFDMRYHDRIFDIFQRLHRVEDYPGTGIGLAIVRKAMERMHGRVHARSEPGRGATFVLEFTCPTGRTVGETPA